MKCGAPKVPVSRLEKTEGPGGANHAGAGNTPGRISEARCPFDRMNPNERCCGRFVSLRTTRLVLTKLWGSSGASVKFVRDLLAI